MGRLYIADKNSMCAVGNEAVEVDSDIEGNKVTVLYDSFPGRNSVDDLVVDADAGTSRKILLIPCRNSTKLADKFTAPVVDFLCADTRF